MSSIAHKKNIGKRSCDGDGGAEKSGCSKQLNVRTERRDYFRAIMLVA